jgi:hypothetical protein
MRRRRLVAVTWIASVAVPAAAWSDEPAGDVAAASEADATPAAPAPRVGYGALPGGQRVASAEALAKGTISLALLSGYGYRKGLLATEHVMTRAIGDVAVAYAPLGELSIALSLDGRYDKHEHDPMDKSDDGYVGAPHLMARYVAPAGRFSLGGELGIWFPGEDAPSVTPSAISVDARGLASYDAGFAVLSVNAGFRLDNSKESVDDRGMLSAADLASLGVSDFHAVIAGASLRAPLGPRAYTLLEGSADVFVGDGAPGPIVRGGLTAGVAINDALSLIAFAEVAHVPRPERDAAAERTFSLIPFEPTVTGGLGLQARFGGPRRVAAASQVTQNKVPEVITVIETAEVSGLIVDETGKPVVGARVTVKNKSHNGAAVSDDKGAFRIGGLPIGKTVDGRTELDDTAAELTIDVDKKKPSTTTLVLAKGANAVPQIKLDPLLPPGQLRGVITNVANGRPVPNASVSIEPGGTTVTAGADGKFTVDLAPGRYKITVTAKALAPQTLDVNIEENGVAIKNIDMHK